MPPLISNQGYLNKNPLGQDAPGGCSLLYSVDQCAALGNSVHLICWKATLKADCSAAMFRSDFR